MKNVIEISNLQKSFGEVRAISDVSFCVGEGEMFAFLGVNGAGKSTTINIMCGQLKKDGGTVVVCGKEVNGAADAAARELGVVFQNSVLDKPLTVEENLRYRAALYGMTGESFKARLLELAEALDFGDILGRAVGKLSGGQRRRIDIARALIHKPKILILDEPTTGLDPQTRRVLWNFIENLRKTENMTVFLTTHYMEEAADADKVVILDGGRVSASGTPLELKNAYTGDFIMLYGAAEGDVLRLGEKYERFGDAYKISVKNTAAATSLIIKYPEIFRDYEITKGKMDDVFLAVTGKKLAGGAKND